MSTLSINALEKAIWAALGAGIPEASGVFNSIAPPDQAYPFVTFHEQSDQTSYVYTERSWDDLVYEVKAITRGDSTTEANDLARKIELVLTDNDLVLDEGTTMYLRKVSGFSYPEMDHGERFNHAGGLYRVWVG